MGALYVRVSFEMNVNLVCREYIYCIFLFFFFQAEVGIRDLVRSRGLGDVYKRQLIPPSERLRTQTDFGMLGLIVLAVVVVAGIALSLSLIHI